MLLCLDVSFTHMGWSGMEGGKPVALGVICSEKDSGKKHVLVSEQRADRCSASIQELVDVVERIRPQGILAELPSGSQSAAAANLLGWASGAVVSAFTVLRIPTEWVNPNEVKKAVIGKRDATKDEIMDRVADHYGWRKEEKVIRINKGKRAGKTQVQKTFHTVSGPFSGGDFEHIADSIGVYWAAKHRNLVRQYG